MKNQIEKDNWNIFEDGFMYESKIHTDILKNGALQILKEKLLSDIENMEHNNIDSYSFFATRFTQIINKRFGEIK